MPRKAKWNGPSTAIRVPQHCADELLAIARLLDAPAEDWNESVGLLPQVAQRLAIFHGLIESSVRALKRIKEPSLEDYEQFVDAVWGLVTQHKESSYRLFCDRVGQRSNRWPRPLGFGDLVEILSGPRQGQHGYVWVWSPDRPGGEVTIARSDWDTFSVIKRSHIRLIERRAMTDAERQLISDQVVARHREAA